jgi:hypothetical protein
VYPASMRRLALTAIAAALIATCAVTSASASTTPRPEPFVDAVLAAFKTHDVVALGDVYGSSSEFRLIQRLIADRRFAAAARTIVVEFGNARYQTIADRYLAGGAVTHRQLETVWLSTTQQSGIWESPVYQDFFVKIRAINKHLPKARQLRVVLGDPPINWKTIHQCSNPPEDWKNPHCIDYWYQRRDTYFASRVRKYVLATHGKALLIEGSSHLWRYPSTVTGSGMNTVGLLEADGRTRVYVISPYLPFAEPQHDAEELITSWPAGSVATIAGTSLGALPGQVLFGPPPRSTPEQPRVPDPRATSTLADLFDAFLYFK